MLDQQVLFVGARYRVHGPCDVTQQQKNETPDACLSKQDHAAGPFSFFRFYLALEILSWIFSGRDGGGWFHCLRSRIWVWAYCRVLGYGGDEPSTRLLLRETPEP